MNGPERRNLRQRLQRGFLLAIVMMALGSLLVFGLDYAIYRLRAAAGWNAFDTVTVNHYTAVLQKNGKTNLTFDPPAPWTCVNALFPHGGMMPCWYLKRYPDQRTDI